VTGSLDPGALLRRLHEAGVRHVVVGGFAVIAHGVLRTTNDLDICPDDAPDNLARLAAVLAELHARHAGAAEFDAGEFPYDPTRPDELAAGGNFRLSTDLGELDVMQWLPGIGEDAYDVLAAEAISADVDGVPVSVCSLEHLRSMKRAADRPQDRADLERLALAHGDSA
jgi:predicted nucleotidyltransferase